ncbi:MAG: nuclear transport factor 2 family protein [Polaromonas sp.]|uniref:nuclear transport factor 2 family protein n=1 Tax=Polaromonas sp. TaxID=1869339 RepID=UPI0040355297
MTPAITRFVHFFESLAPDSVAQLGEVYTRDVYFKDPFNEVHTLAEVQQIFRHMYVALDRPRFVVTGQVGEGNECFLTWNFEFYFRKQRPAVLQTVRGTSHLKFNGDGLVSYHRDYWDAAEELYEKLPLLGSLMRWLRKRVNS